MTAEERMKISKECPLWEMTMDGAICSKKRYINNEGKASALPKKGYVKGCGCLLYYKTKNPNSHCVAGL